MPRGSVVSDAAVLTLLERGDPGPLPVVHHVLGRRIVAWSSTRVHMKRDGWELVTPDSLVVIWVRPRGEDPWALAMSPSELERTFGEVAQSRSWDEVREYHWPRASVAAKSFRVRHDRVAAKPSGVPEGVFKARPMEAIVRDIEERLEDQQSLTDSELTRLAGGSRRYRQLLSRMRPRIHVEQTAMGAVWSLRP